MRPKNSTPYFIDAARARLIIAAVAIEFGVPEAEIIAPLKGPSAVSYARQVSMYLMCCTFNATKSRVAEIFGRHFSTVSHACTVIEDQRDDPVLDGKLLILENFLNQMPDVQAS